MRRAKFKRQGILTRKLSLLLPEALIIEIEELFPGRSLVDAVRELLMKMVSILKAGQASATKLDTSKIIKDIGESL